MYVHQAPPDVKGRQCLKSSGTGVINVPCCLGKSQAWEYLTPCTIWKPFLAHENWYFRNSGLLPAYCVSFAWLDSLTTPTLLSFTPYHFLRLNVLAASSALCLSFPSYFKNPSSLTSKTIYVLCTSTSSCLCCSTEVQIALWSSDRGVNNSGEDDRASQGSRFQRFLSWLQYKYMIRKYIVEKIKGKEIKD